MKTNLSKPAGSLLFFIFRLLCILLLLAFFIWGSAKATEYHVAKSGNDSGTGSAQMPFLTISKAASVAQAGDIITVHTGTYRELIVPARGGTSNTARITYQSAKGETVIIKGSEVIQGWQIDKNGIWTVKIPNRFFANYNPYQDLVFGDWFFPGRNQVHTGEIYLNGKPLGELAQTAGEMSWSTQQKADTTVLQANFGKANPNQTTVEINVRPACFYPAKTHLNYITIRGFHFSQAATQWAAPTAEQTGLIGTNWSKGWVIENNTISDSKCVGIALGKDRASGHNVWFANRETDGSVHYNQMVHKVIAEGWSKNTIGSHLVKNNTIFRCGQAGVVGSFGAAFSEISGNHIYDVYTYRNFWGAEMAGIKLHAGIDALIKDNRIHNAQKGIWLDWMGQGTRVSSNLLYDNDFVDLFMEVNHGPYLVDNNFFLSPYNLKDLSQGGAFVHNLFAGLLSRAPDDRQTPYFAANSTRFIAIKPIKGGDDRFLNNIFIGREGRSFHSGTYPAKLPDEIDPLAGYGLNIYNQAALPVSASGNLYLNGAYPLDAEKNALKGFDKAFSFKTQTKGETFSLTILSPYQLSTNLAIVTSQVLGKNSNNQPFTQPDGSKISLGKDYFESQRSTKTFPGPMKWASGKAILLWPKNGKQTITSQTSNKP